MSEKIEILLYSKGELREDLIPSHWDDPEGLTHVAPHHRVLFLDNPLSRDDGDPVRAYALVDGRVAGKVSLIPGEVVVGDRSLRVLWGFDLLVSNAFRGRGLAIKLIQAWQDHDPVAMGTHVNLPSVGIYRKFGWVEFHTPTWVAVLRGRRFLQGYLRQGALAALAAPVADGALALRRVLGPRAAAGLRAEPATALSPALDAALARPTAPAMTHRSAAWVNWQMRVGAAEPGGSYRLFQVLDARDEVVGYFVLQLKVWPLLGERFRDVRLGSVRDWGVLDPQRCDLTSLYLLAAGRARALGADAAMVTVFDEEVGRRLAAGGFRPAKPLMTLFHADAGSPLAAEAFRDAGAWRFTPAEADGLVV